MTEQERDDLSDAVDKLINKIMKDVQVAAAPLATGHTKEYQQMWAEWVEKHRAVASELENLKTLIAQR